LKVVKKGSAGQGEQKARRVEIVVKEVGPTSKIRETEEITAGKV